MLTKMPQMSHPSPSRTLLETRAPLPLRTTRAVCYYSSCCKLNCSHGLPGPAPSKPTAGGPRASRKQPARRIEVQPTRLEAVDDALDPLGPLGADPIPGSSSTLTDQAPTPPKKELNARGSKPATPGYPPSDYGETALPVGRGKGPPPVQPQAGAASRQTQPSVSVEQAAKPTFEIYVGDPHKVGDLTSSHIVYQVRTKVRT